MKALVGAFDKEKALVGAFSVITNLRMELFEALVTAVSTEGSGGRAGEAGEKSDVLLLHGHSSPPHHTSHGALTTLSSYTVTQPRENSGWTRTGTRVTQVTHSCFLSQHSHSDSG